MKDDFGIEPGKLWKASTWKDTSKPLTEADIRQFVEHLKNTCGYAAPPSIDAIEGWYDAKGWNRKK